MFDEMENVKLERLNNWYSGHNDVKKEVWVERFEYFLCRKYEKFNDVKKTYDELIKSLRRYEIKISDAEKISKFANALPLEWDEFLSKLKKRF
ncbi:hypothetical protein Hanom_Chr04g00318581 [Helianthus anomalus]